MLGHNDLQTTSRYTRSDVEDVRVAMEVVEKSQSRHTADRRGKNERIISRLRQLGLLLRPWALTTLCALPEKRVDGAYRSQNRLSGSGYDGAFCEYRTVRAAYWKSLCPAAKVSTHG
jgi:hypothetical protein